MYSRFFVFLACIVLLGSAACKEKDDDPLPQSDSVAVAPPSGAGQRTDVAQGKPQEGTPQHTTTPSAPKGEAPTATQPKERFKNPVLRFRKPRPPQEKGDTYAEAFMGMEGKIGKELHPSVSAKMWNLTAIRVAEHEYFDRIIFEFDAEKTPGYELEYPETPTRLCDVGIRVRTEGSSQIKLTIRPARIINDSLIAKERHKLSLPIMRELVRTCNQDGELTFIIGVTSQKKFRLCELQDPARIMLDLRNDEHLELEEGEQK